MIALDVAQARLFALAVPMPTETVPLISAHGRWLTDPLIAKRTQPARDVSAMDGYAVAHDTALNIAPEPWRIIGESAAGKPFGGIVGKGQTVRISTGARLPHGTDTVIVQEDIELCSNAVVVNANVEISHAQHVRKAGSDFCVNDVLTDGGLRVSPATIALAAAAGYGALCVRRMPRVAILSIGTELVPPGAPVDDGHLPSSNAVMIAAMISSLPCHVTDLGIVPDDMNAITAAITRIDADILVTTGGASVGDHDLVRPALLGAGATIDFWRIAMRPGKPLMAGKMGSTVVLGLPGNPVSAYVTALLFLMPLVRVMGGAADPLPKRSIAKLDGILPATAGRTDHIRAFRSIDRVRPLPSNDSGALLDLARSNCLIVRQAGAEFANIGDNVTILA